MLILSNKHKIKLVKILYLKYSERTRGQIQVIITTTDKPISNPANKYDASIIDSNPIATRIANQRDYIDDTLRVNLRSLGFFSVDGFH